MKSNIRVLSLLTAVFIFSFNLIAYSQQWVLAGSVPNPGLSPSISVFNGQVVWIAGGAPDSPKIYRSSNGGANWTSITTNGTTTELQCIWAISSTVAIAGEGTKNSFARLYKFASDGTKWNVVLETGMNDGGFNNLIFSRTNPMVGGALADEIYLTTDGGITWVKKVTGVTGVSSAQNSLMLVDQTFFGFGLKNGSARVRMTNDAGNTWSTKSINLNGSYTSGFTFKENKFIGLSSTSSSMPYIARTTDGGNTFSQIDIGTGLTGNTIIKWIPGTDVVYILGANGAVKRSTNNGLNWTSMSTAGVTGLTHFDFNNINNIICGYAVSSNGSVIKLVDSVLVLTGFIGNETGLPSEFNLSQNYPNPFNPTTTINYSLPKNSFVKLAVSDILGREVATLVNENKTSGKYEVVFDASKLTSGIYYYSLKTNEFSKTKQMVLIK